MKLKTRSLGWIAVFLMLALFIVGWLTSTRHFDFQFTENGFPCANARVWFIYTFRGQNDRITVDAYADKSGMVRLPSLPTGGPLSVTVAYGKQPERRFLAKLRRGKTTVDFNGRENRLTYFYRFLLYCESSSERSVTPHFSH